VDTLLLRPEEVAETLSIGRRPCMNLCGAARSLPYALAPVAGFPVPQFRSTSRRSPQPAVIGDVSMRGG
jgi:hypothetical protein